MKKLIVIATFLAFGAASITFAGTRVEMKDSEQARQAADIHKRYDHPKAQVVKNDDLKIDITRDQIMYSCCMPPNLVVTGKITNISPRPIGYVRLNFAFEDKSGKILHAESLFNHKAESMADDANVQRILNEKPHFEPLQPGQSDTFGFTVSCTELPTFSKVELFSNEVKP
jgi:23S rRNA C2498 (ribose-2'-O)-methylase RlmM